MTEAQFEALAAWITAEAGAQVNNRDPIVKFAEAAKAAAHDALVTEEGTDAHDRHRA